MSSSSGYVAAALGAVAGLLWLRRAGAEDKAKSKPKPPTPPKPGFDCKSLLNPYAIAACEGAKLADKLLDAIGGEPNWTAMDGENRRLNGEVEVGLDDALKSRSYCRTAGNPSYVITLLQGGVARFKNGCEPFMGAPGWVKCVPGTKSMWRNCAPHESSDGGKTYYAGALVAGGPLAGSPALPADLSRSGDWRVDAAYPGRLGTLIRGDAFTAGPFRGGDLSLAELWSHDKRVAVKFPLPIPAGSWGWFVGARPLVCPEGAIPERVRDHRVAGGYVLRCGAGGKAPPRASGGEHTQTRYDQSTAPPGYVWVVDHWERA